MKSTYLGLLTVLSTSLGVSASWEVTAYNIDVGDCNPPIDSGDKGMYRIFTGTDGYCHNISGAAPGMTCQQYTNGGVNGPMDCGNERIEAGSLEIYGNVYCQIYGSQDCISASKILYGCGNPTAGAWSFQCYVEG